VARGCPTSEIAGRLHLSAYTVQDRPTFAASTAWSVTDQRIIATEFAAR
jgi:hypothetical protein